MQQTIRVGTRGSKLAVTQTKQALKKLEAVFPAISFQLITITTKGDREQTASLTAIGGQGVFVKELEHQLLTERIDLAVHSLKDMPTISEEELTIGSVLERENPSDCLIFAQPQQTLQSLPVHAVVGTSSLRRQAQLLRLRPDIHIVPLRGNIDTRIQKVQQGEYDAIVLATAGLARLGWLNRQLFTQELSFSECLPAVGQGALAMQCRTEDKALLEMLQAIEHQPTRLAVEAERSFLRQMDGSCTFPIGALAQVQEGSILMRGMLASGDGQQLLIDAVTGENPLRLGQELANKLFARGGEDLIQESRHD